MTFIGDLLNLIGILIGSLIGLGLKNYIKDELRTGSIIACGLVVCALSVQMILAAENTIVILLSMVIGTVIGELVDLDEKMNRFGKKVENLLMAKSSRGKFSAGFVYATILFCTGAMGIMGSLESGISGEYSILASKAVIDMVLSVALAVTMGVGVMGSALTTFIYQGVIILAAGALSSVLTEEMIQVITSVGGLLVLSIGLNLLNLGKFKTPNMLPAVILAPLMVGLLG